MEKLLIVDDNVQVLKSISRVLETDFKIFSAQDEQQAKACFKKDPDIILLDINLNQNNLSDRTGVQLLDEFLKARPHIPVVMISAYGDVATAVECMRKGASDFIIKPPHMDELNERLKRALRHSKTLQKAEHLEARIHQIEPSQIIGASPEILKIKKFIEKISQDRYATVLIQGETGTGKELVARAIHRLGPRVEAPCVAVSVSALNPNLVESELFGHVKGAFAGAHVSRIGFIEKAKGGILFLDEIGELSQEIQVKLLRFLEERKFFPVGSSNPVEVDLQVVVATHRDLKKEVAEGRFREDLYYRLGVIPVFIPPLRERKEDIPFLIHHFLNIFRQQGRTKIEEVSPEVLQSLCQRPWPGNIRQLKNEIERAILQAWMQGHSRIEVEDLSPEFLNQPPTTSSIPIFPQKDLPLEEALAKCELSYIEGALKKAHGRKSEAWKALGLNDRYALSRRVKTISKKFPHLLEEFSLICKLYHKHTRNK